MTAKTLSIFAIGLLLCTPGLFAQTPTEEASERTNPNAGSIAPGSGLTLSGTVVSWNEDEVVVDTVTGIEHIRFDNRTNRPVSFTEGEMLSIDYIRTSQGVMIAREIRPDGTNTEVTIVNTTPITPDPVEGEMHVDVDADAELDVDLDTEPEVVADFDADADLDTDVHVHTEQHIHLRDELPRTASSLPLALLVGLSSLIAALGLRIARS